ncbi:hypothetical protein [Chryseobacterium sp. OV279]|uniref:hypothetical protein n=1 Tax=Chryseobacterium sp. OV279 TaxID=1500285 RepID=UPI00091BC12B|nr:hypothetical protein [Chryseobacterium sp. OV279]SHF92358.1 hypothetical protein SAMN02787100_2989 [Chryseobacterium sp. OV279]
MKNIKQIGLVILNISIPPLLYLLIIFYIFFAHGSGNGADIYVKTYGKYIMTGYFLTGIVHIFLVYKYLTIQKQIKLILATILLAIYAYIAFTNY